MQNAGWSSTARDKKSCQRTGTVAPKFMMYVLRSAGWMDDVDDGVFVSVS